MYALKHIFAWKLGNIYADILVCISACVHSLCVCVILYSVCCPFCSLSWLDLTSWTAAILSGTTVPWAKNVYFDPAIQAKNVRAYSY